MAKKTVDELTSMSYEQLDDRLRVLYEQVQARISRCETENRDMEWREAQLTEAAKTEMGVIRDAILSKDTEAQQREHSRVRGEQIGRAIEQRRAGSVWRPTLLVSESNLRSHADALREGRSFGAIESIESRSLVTASADMGSAGGWNSGQPNAPRTLIAFSGVPISQLTGRTAQVPAYTGPSGVAGHDEGADHDEYDSVTKIDLTALRYGRWSDVSSVVNELDDLRGVNTMHGWGISRDLDRLAVDAIETAAGPPVVDSGTLEGDVREAILTVSAACYAAQETLVIVGTPADLALLTDTTPTSGSDVESFAVRFNGARLYPSAEATVGQVSVFAPTAYRVFQSPLQSATVINPADGGTKFGSWLHSTELGQQIVGSAVAVATGLGESGSS